MTVITREQQIAHEALARRTAARRAVTAALRNGALILACLFTVFPFFWMLVSALKTKSEIMNTAIFWPSIPQWGNLVEVTLQSPLLKYVANSLFVASVTVFYQVVSGAMLAYSLVYLSFRGRRMLFLVVMGTYMVPTAASYIPAYIILSRMDLVDSFGGLIISNLVSIFGIFLLRQNFLQIPRQLIEAARIDGANHWQALWRLVCPISRSSFITFGLMSFITSYNSYLWPRLITNSPDLYLVSQGLRAFFVEGGAYGTDWPKVMAGSALIVFPLLLLFVFTQKWFISGIGGDTGIKG